MNLSYGSDGAKKFITNIGLITSYGSYGYNIMSAEWTHHISYSPGIIAVCINPDHLTHENISKTKEFGVNICAVDQHVIASIAGGISGKNVDKIKILKELGFEFYKAKKINVLMVKGASLNAECKLIRKIKLGDHTMFVGEVITYHTTDKEPLAYHKGKYWKIGKNIRKPNDKELEKIDLIIEKYKV